MWKLVIEDDEGKRTLVPLTRAEYSIGRRDGNTIRLTERNVSRDHARLYLRNGVAGQRSTFVLEDLTSYNGIFVNGLRISHAQDLAHGDLVQIGDYRVVLQDESQETDPGAVDEDAKQTNPQGHGPYAASLLDRPNRLVMLAGPTPGNEFPLDRDRLTIGRAEDANISVNHNSVSRLHCEVHELGDGRFEIVDKGSSNGVRVNGADLRRGIVEPGDLIELGDVRFKFVGAGQIFRPTESQQLAAISDRTASDMVSGRRSNALPIAIFVVVVLAGAVGAWAYFRPHGTSAAEVTAAARSPEQMAIDEAKKLCSDGDCDTAHATLDVGVAPGSPLRQSPDFKDVENRWADQVLARADGEGDLIKKRALFQRVAQATTVDAARRKTAADKLQQLDAVASASSADPSRLPVVHPDEPSSSSRPDAARRTALASETGSLGGSSGSGSTTSVDDRERALALMGTQESKVALKQTLEARVQSGRASEAEIRLLISTCKDLGDKGCIQQARAVLAQRQQ